jgi:pyruvate dehydrogenase E2 component (dihydrolipoamide acetyltransferase)
MRHVIILPDLGQTTNEATIRQFLKQPGEAVRRGEPILAVSTDKVEMEVESFANGYLREWLTEEGSLASAMSAVAIVTDGVDEPYVLPGANGDSAAAAVVPKAAAKPSPEKAVSGRISAAPAARALAKERNIDLSQISGTGPDGLITKADVLSAAERSGKPSPASPDKPSPASSKNRALAAMAATTIASMRDIPHFYATADVSMAQAAAWRERWNSAHSDLRATYNDIFVLAAARSLRDLPRLNMSYSGGSYQQRSAADVCLVVAREPAMVLAPLPDPTASSWEVFLKDIRKAGQLSAVAKAEPLLAISNLGMFGVRQFAAIIPPGFTSALAIGAVREQPALKDGVLVNELVCSLTISADHRVVDGVAAARFLERIQFHLNSL